MVTYLIVLMGCHIAADVFAEQYCYYSYVDQTNVLQSGTLFCTTNCCGTVENRSCCASSVGVIVGVVAGGTLGIILITIIVICCVLKAKKTPIRRLTIPSDLETEVAYLPNHTNHFEPAGHPHSNEYCPPIQEDSSSFPDYDPPPYSP